MAYEMKNNSGTIFRNERKEAETHADYNGTALIDGVEYYVNMWIKESSSGKKFFSTSYKRKDSASKSAPAPKAKATVQQDLDDDLPF